MAATQTISRAGSMIEGLVGETERFKASFLSKATLGLGVIAVIALPLSASGANPASGVIACALGLAACAASYLLARSGYVGVAGRLFLYGILAALLSSVAQPAQRTDSIALDGSIFIVIDVLAGFLLARADMLIVAATGTGALSIIAYQASSHTATRLEVILPLVLSVLFLWLTDLCTSIFVGHSRAAQERLHHHVTDIDRVVARADRIASGDLSGDVEGTTQVSETVRAMLDSLRNTVLRVREAGNGLAAATQEIAAMARQQEQGAVEQAAAVTEIRTTLGALLEASSRVAENTQDVFRSVEQTQATSEKIAERIATLSSHTRRITAILDVIKGIANKSDILALNASLEGARAGEAGRGFSLVASQMQRLAENVMDSVKDVRSLTDDIETATNATVIATEEGTKLAARATAAARQISVTSQQQRSSTEQVSAAMQDIGEVARQVSTGSTQTLSATRDLTRLAEDLQKSIQRFQL